MVFDLVIEFMIIKYQPITIKEQKGDEKDR